MNPFKLNPETKAEKWLLSISLNAGFLWLFIAFVLRKVFAYLQFDLFLLGILPNFFAGIGLYLILYLRLKSKVTPALIAFCLLALA